MRGAARCASWWSAGGMAAIRGRWWLGTTQRVCLVLAFICVASVGAQEELPLFKKDPASCKDVEPKGTYTFDLPSLSCKTCKAPEVPSPTGTGCVCPAGYKSEFSVDNKRACVQCPAAFPEVSHDGLECLACPSSSSNSNSSGSSSGVVAAETDPTVDENGVCSCPTGFMLSDLNSTGQRSPGSLKTCILCPFSTYVDDADPFSCKPCPDTLMHRAPSGECVCKDGYVEDSILIAEGDSLVVPFVGRHKCLDKEVVNTITYNVAQYAKFSFYNALDASGSRTSVIAIEQSAPFMKYFLEAAVKCSSARSAESCQTLANLCALQLHDEDAPSCKLLSTLSALVLNKAVHNFAGWIDGFPWTAYENKARDELFTTDINRVVSLRGGSSVMSMTLSKYAMDGTFLGFESLKTQLTLCRGDERVLASYQRFGSNVRRECTVDLRQLIADPSEPVFYELWIDDPVDRAGKERAEGTALYPVPVIIANYGSPPDDAPNQFLARNLNIDLTFASPELEKVVLHRRFFLVDAVSGRKSRGATADREDPSLQVVRWAKSVILRVSLQIDDPDTPFDESLRILPPYVVIEYEQQQTSIIPEEDLGFGAENEALRYAPVSFVSQYTMNLEYYWRVMFILMFVMIGLVIIDFGVKISVRTQSKAMDPIGIAADLFGSVAGVFFWSLWFFAAYWFFFFKLQSEPKTLMPLENPHHDYLTLVIIAISCKVLNVIFLVYRQCCVDIFFIDWEKEKAPDDGIVKEKAGELPNVSVWRYILIANEWCEMQCNRHTDVDFTLMFCLLFLAGLKFEHLATQQPSATDLTPGEPNMVVRFFVISMFYFTVVLIQLLYKALTYRFERDPLDHFADLCNLANISTFILDEELHGYYIHGRAVHPHCDVNMQKMQANLAAEAEGNLPFRGLTQKGEADLQGASDSVFELYVTNDIRDKYSQHVEGALRGGGKKSGARVDQQAAAQHSINEFLGHHVIDDLAQNASDVVILPSIAHKLTGAPPSRKSESAVLIRDSANLYSRVLLYGIEYDLILFDLLVFVAWDLIFVDVFIAALFTYIIAHALIELRAKYGTANVAAKTLVDERFLA